MKYVALVLVALLTACGGGGGGGGSSGGAVAISVPAQPSPEPTPAPVVDCSVALYGDSIMYGDAGNFTRIQTPIANNIKLKRPAYAVTDMSRNGDSTELHFNEFMNDSFVGSRIVVIEYGINDAGLGYEYTSKLRAMVQRVKALNKIPVITGLSQTRESFRANRGAYNEKARQVAVQENVLFIDWGTAEFNDADMRDDIHPAQAYSNRLAEKLVVNGLDVTAPECK